MNITYQKGPIIGNVMMDREQRFEVALIVSRPQAWWSVAAQIQLIISVFTVECGTGLTVVRLSTTRIATETAELNQLQDKELTVATFFSPHCWAFSRSGLSLFLSLCLLTVFIQTFQSFIHGYTLINKLTYLCPSKQICNMIQFH